MNHVMKLKSRYFDYMKNGTKRIEIRLNDEKRKLIKVGDTITFLKEPELTDKLNTKVIELLKYDNFDDMFNDIDISLLADKSMSKEELINVLEEFYTKEKQKEYGVLGIRIELL